MFLGKLNDALILRFKGKDKNDPNVRGIATFYNNLSYKEVYRSTDWFFRQKTGQLTIIPNYITGTCSITRYDGTNEALARTVTFVGSTLTSSMQGRYFQPLGSDGWYKIVSVDVTANTIYLESPIIDDTEAGISFKIWKRFYYLYSEVDAFLGFSKWSLDGRMRSKSAQLMASEVSEVANFSTAPNKFSLYGVDPYDSSYSTGQVSISKDTNIATGVSTEWLSNASPGDILTINNNSYRVKRAETDTKIILYNYPTENISNQAYTLEKDSPMGFQFYPTEDAYRLLDYIYMARSYDMVNESKEKPLMPGDDYDEVILTRAESMRMRDNDDPKWSSVVQLYSALLDGLRQKRHPDRTTFDQFAPKVPSYMPGRGRN